MDNSLAKIVDLLSNAEYCDDIFIADRLNITQAAVEKAIKQLQAYGIQIQSTKNKGYRLIEPLILLDEEKIKSFLKTKTIDFKIFETIDSTNDHLKKIVNRDKMSTVCIAEMQTKGRGRLDRAWHSPFGQNIYLSLRYSFPQNIDKLSGLSLIVGLSVVKSIEDSSKTKSQLLVKWPNDIIANRKKMGGILIEIQSNSDGLCDLIIGIGINVNMCNSSKEEINQPWISVRELSRQYEDRNSLIAAIIDNLLFYLQRFHDFGLKDFIEEWKTKDSLFNQSLQLESNKDIYIGVGSGIDEQGHLVLTLKDGQKKTFGSGDTTLIK